MTLMPSISVDLTKPETHTEAFIASRVVFVTGRTSTHTFLISCADDEPEIVQVHIAEPKRTAVYEPETQPAKLQLTAVFA